MQYPLQEKIGDPSLLVGRAKEFGNFAKWLANIPRKLSKSRVILARRKSGKTAFVQRIFNRLWSENGVVIPFYFEIAENKVWYPTFAIRYYCAFASQYISFLERDATLIKEPLSLAEIRAYGQANAIRSFVRDVDTLFENNKVGGGHGLMWEAAYSAPHRLADLYDRRVLVILDEFQNITQYIYPDPERRTEPDETLAGSFHNHVESKIAPMLVTGSYVRWLINISREYLQAGRLSRIYMPPYLASEEGLQAVYKYAEVYQEPITNETALQINQLCMADPFFISCVVQSNYDHKDLTTQEGVVNTVNYEITSRDSEMSMTWGEYIELTLQRINDRYAKNILLHLSKYPDRDWTPQEVKDALHLDIDLHEIHRRLRLLVESDVIMEGASDIDYRGLQDGTLYLILRHRFEKEISTFAPDLKQDFHQDLETLRADRRRLQGMLNNLASKVAEHQLANEFRTRKRFALSLFFKGGQDTTVLNIIDVRERVLIQRADGKQMEIDVQAISSCGRVVLVEVKKTEAKTGLRLVEDFQEKVVVYAQQFPEKIMLPAFLSLGGFTDEALRFCRAEGIGTAEAIVYQA